MIYVTKIFNERGQNIDQVFLGLLKNPYQPAETLNKKEVVKK